MKYELEFEIPRTPNFIKLKNTLGIPESQQEISVPIRELTNEQIDYIADQWKKDLKERASKARSVK